MDLFRVLVIVLHLVLKLGITDTVQVFNICTGTAVQLQLFSITDTDVIYTLYDIYIYCITVYTRAYYAGDYRYCTCTVSSTVHYKIQVLVQHCNTI